MNQLKAWMVEANPAEQQALADAAGTSRKYLYHLANDTAAYARGASADLARRLEEAAVEINRRNPKLPRLLRVDLNSACRRCEFARKCLGEDAITEAEFRVVGTGEEHF